MIGSFSVRHVLSIVIVLAIGSLAAPPRAWAQFELFGGYSYLHASVPVGQFGPLGSGTPCPPNCGNPPSITQHADLANGWEFSGEYKLLPFFGGVADFSGNYGTLDGAATNVHTYLIGPQVSLPGRFSPFAHVLAGFAHVSQNAIASGAFFSLGSDTSFATAFGGGLDFKALPFISLRLIQIDYLRTQWHGMTQGQPRISAGIVLHF